jgi:Xaa-Pro dipeptidase
MDRREMMKALPAAGAALTSLTAAHAATAADAHQFAPLPKVQGQPLLNVERARTIMKRLNIDGLIAANPINVYYLTNVTPLSVRFRSELGGFATFPRDANQARHLICTTAETWDIANADRDIPEPIFFSSAKAGSTAPKGVEPEANQPRNYAVRAGVSLTEREQRWDEWQKKANGSVAPGAAWAIVRALKKSGLDKGRIAVDDMRVKYLLEQIGFDSVTIVPGDDVFKLIRMVKTPTEIELMRIGGRNNEAAAMAAMKRVQVGMTFRDVENLFRQECADRGSTMLNLVVGMPGGDFADGVAVKGKPYIVDAVSHYAHYNGDFARTLVLGEPTKEVLARAKANKKAREAVFELVKPGVKFSELRKVAFDTMVKEGIPDFAVFVTPHSVGLQHTDHPFRLDGIDPAPIDHVLEENMVMTIDLPYVEVGWGCGHNEDLFRVTQTGYEALNPESDPLVVV